MGYHIQYLNTVCRVIRDEREVLFKPPFDTNKDLISASKPWLPATLSEAEAKYFWERYYRYTGAKKNYKKGKLMDELLNTNQEAPAGQTMDAGQIDAFIEKQEKLSKDAVLEVLDEGEATIQLKEDIY